jgi:hypothetical protein
MKKILLLLLLSLAVATGIFFTNNIIVSQWQDAVPEIAVTAIPVFIVIALLYYINRAIFRKVRGLKKKKPSGQEGSGI